MYPPQCYEYLVYLRHHGFPSPFLDWTESPYIAAYFAFCDYVKSKNVAVFAYVETPVGFKLKKGGHPMITVLGPYATTHARHFAQKAWYTIATKWSSKDNKHYFYPHRNSLGTSSQEQDVLIKITIPARDRLIALRELSDYNINHFTLFQTEDALVKAMTMKQFDLAAK
ncbi:MAG: FRG domain-containing protein [Desulfobacterales bacterium]|nr:FRG domain-containing protein [Desulfobacterales bacterium]